MKVIACVKVYVLFHTTRFPKIQSIDTHYQLPTLHKHSADRVKKHRQAVHLCCCLWPVPVSVGFTGSFTPPCHASPHQRPQNTDSLYNHSSAWEEPSATHRTGFVNVYAFTRHVSFSIGGECNSVLNMYSSICQVLYFVLYQVQISFAFSEINI